MIYKNILPQNKKASQEKLQSGCEIIFHKPLNLGDFTIDNFKKNFTKSELRVVDRLLVFCIRFKRVFPGRKRLAIESDTSPRTVQRAINKLQDLGFIPHVQRGSDTSLYYAHPLFDNKEARLNLKTLFSCLFVLPLMLLVATSQNLAQYKDKDSARNRFLHDFAADLSAPLCRISQFRTVFVHDFDKLTLMERLKCVFSPEELLPLMAFSRRCLAYAIRCIKERYATIRDKLAYMWGCCWEYSNRMQEPQDWELVAALRSVRGTPSLPSRTVKKN